MIEKIVDAVNNPSPKENLLEMIEIAIGRRNK